MLNTKLLGGTASKPAEFIDDVFSTYLYTGNGSTQTINNGIDLAGEGGMVWCKGRNDAFWHSLIDTARGNTKTLHSNTTSAEGTYTDAITSFNNNGFTLGADTQGGYVNASTYNFASWTFRKAPKFFDVVTYTGNGVNGRTISHNLGSTPGMIIVKRTNGTQNWYVYHRNLTSAGYYLWLNSTAAQSNTNNAWNSTAPTSTNFTVGDLSFTNGSGDEYVAYLFAHDAGGFGAAGTDNVISCGSFVTGSTGVETITLGYEPQYVMFKRADSTGDWIILDNMRGFSNGSVDAYLYANTSDAETTAGYGHPTATGFVINAGFGSGQTYIYMAIRRPMKPPTSGTEVFMPVATTAAVNTKITTNFPVDLQIQGFRTGISVNQGFIDRLRGIGTIPSSTSSVPRLVSSSTAAEASATIANGWDNTGYQISTGWDGNNMVYWNFRRATGFFDVVCYPGTGSATTVAHNLGAVPELIIVKRRAGGTTGWAVYSAPTGIANYLVVNTTDASDADPGNVLWNNTSPTSTVFSVGSNSTVNGSGSTYVAYLFATLAGVSKFGSYTGNGTTQTINCGFTAGARFVLIKRTDSTGDWVVLDTARGIVSGNDPFLELNTSAAEQTGEDIVDPANSGFIVNETTEAINTNAATYIFLAIA